MSNYNKTKAAIISYLFNEKETSYKNMMDMQQSELTAAEQSGENGEGQFQGGKAGQTFNRIEARSSVVEALQRDLDILSGLESIEPTGEIQLGDVVETDRGNFFVAVPADKFTIDGVSYRGISVESPLFQALKGKKNGDFVVINENRFTLINSY
jgi:transcription elongation GreA/GreB family factor